MATMTTMDTMPGNDRHHRLSGIPQHLQISVLHVDDHIIVIDKPCNLRSVPGHANPPPAESSLLPYPSPSSAVSPNGESQEVDGRLTTPRMTAQEAWVSAIQSFGTNPPPSTATESSSKVLDDGTAILLRNLGANKSQSAAIPRKLKPFLRYCHRNVFRLLPEMKTKNEAKGTRPKTAQEGSSAEQSSSEGDEKSADKLCRAEKASAKGTSSFPKRHQNDNNDDCGRVVVEEIATLAYRFIQQRQQPLLQLPEPSRDEDSALGQLCLLGFGRTMRPTSGDAALKRTCVAEAEIRVVHRLDCETSGVMVFARTDEAASALSSSWRERNGVRKVYRARVRHWPPFHRHRQTQGTIELPLAPSETERLKWEVRPQGGKPSTTLWTVVGADRLGAIEDDEEKKSLESSGAVHLDLVPVTGRTHQLRVHCAAVGSGIVGDSLYGDAPIPWNLHLQDPQRNQPHRLQLHAYRLAFPHPATGTAMEFTSPVPPFAPLVDLVDPSSR